MPDSSSNIKRCPHCNGIMCFHNRTLIEFAHWYCVECKKIEIIQEQQ